MKPLKLISIHVFLSILLFSSFASAYEFKGDIYAESGFQNLNSSSAFNPGNLYNTGDFQYFLRGNLIFKNDFSEHMNGLLNLEMQYYPSYYTIAHPFSASDPDAATYNKKERLFVKEMYLDLLTSLFVVRIGKQYIKWGKGSFFNPSDVVNLKRDPLRPIDEAEGKPFASFILPVKSFLSFECLTVIDENENEGKSRLKDLPFIPKISFSASNLSGFAFGVFQNNRAPILGLNLDLAIAAGESTSITLYGEGVYHFESYQRKEVNESLVFEDKDIKNYYASVGGIKIQTSFTETKWVDGLIFTLEYYYNEENWSNKQFKHYIDLLEANKNNLVNHQTYLLSFKAYSNSKDYGYASLYLSNFIKQNLTFGNDFILNMDDKSFILMPSLVYSFENSNAEVGIKNIMYFGNKNSEFGNSLSTLNLILFAQLSF